MLTLLPLRAWLIIAGVAAVLIGGYLLVNTLEKRGYERRIAEETRLILEKTNEATRADDDARRCAADPACRMRPDQYQRD